MTSDDPRQNRIFSAVNETERVDINELPFNDKMKVECLCPKCGRKHVMTFHWIGRGTPRKYCPSCKGSYGG
ncbi:MAG: hypothetical protein PVI13_04235 [Desulfobacterales bacterium]